jgi:hypothetical protein
VLCAPAPHSILSPRALPLSPRHLPLTPRPFPLSQRHSPAAPVASRTHALAAARPPAIPPASYPSSDRPCSSARQAIQAHLSPRARPLADKCAAHPPPNQQHLQHLQHPQQTGAFRSTATRSRTRVVRPRATPLEHPSPGRSRRTSRCECDRGCRTARRTTDRFRSSPRVVVRASRQCPRADESPDQTPRIQPCQKSAHSPMCRRTQPSLAGLGRRAGHAVEDCWRNDVAQCTARHFHLAPFNGIGIT